MALKCILLQKDRLKKGLGLKVFKLLEKARINLEIDFNRRVTSNLQE